jgi:hypothetical protein
LALVLAERIWSWKVLAGLAVLVMIQGWSIAFDVPAQVGLQAGADAGAQRLARRGGRHCLSGGGGDFSDIPSSVGIGN